MRLEKTTAYYPRRNISYLWNQCKYAKGGVERVSQNFRLKNGAKSRTKKKQNLVLEKKNLLEEVPSCVLVSVQLPALKRREKN